MHFFAGITFIYAKPERDGLASAKFWSAEEIIERDNKSNIQELT